MDIFIVVFNRGNRRVRAASPYNAWLTICPTQKEVIFKKLDTKGRKHEVVKNGKRIGLVTHLKRGRGGS